MPVARCRHCRIVLLAGEAEGERCPSCSAALGDVPPAASPRPRRGAWLALTVLVLAGAALIAWFAWPPPASDTADPDPSKEVQDRAVLVAPKPVTGELILAPLRRDDEQKAIAQAEILPLPQIEQPADVPVAPVVGKDLTANVIEFDSPKGDIALEPVNGENRVHLSGRV